MGALQHLQEGCQGRVNFLTVLHGERTRGSRHKSRGFNWGKKKKTKQKTKQNKTFHPEIDPAVQWIAQIGCWLCSL